MHLRGVGIDIVDVRRVARLLEGRGAFRTRWFTAGETARCDAAPDPARAYAAVLAAKEAAWKALGVKWDGGVPWAGLTVLERPGGWAVELTDDAVRAAGGHGGPQVVGSWTDDGDVAVAVALAVRSP